MPYNGVMLLISSQASGAIYSVVILLICFVVAHVVKLVSLGYRARKRPPAKEEPPPEPKPEPEPIYYIVEKKKKRAKAEYSEPKRISFK